MPIFKLFFEVQEFKIIYDITRGPLDSHFDRTHLCIISFHHWKDMVLVGGPVKGKQVLQTHTWALQLGKMHFARAHEEGWSPPAY